MPTTPETWLSQVVVNSVTTGSQRDTDIIQLTNGNILVSWRSDADIGAGSPAGFDVIGQLFDPFGARIGDEIRLNHDSTNDLEFDATIAATAQGGFLVTYADFEEGATNPYRIQLDHFNAAGVFQSGTGVDLSSIRTFDPQVLVSSATQAMVFWIEDDSDNSVRFRRYDPSTGNLEAEATLLTNLGGIVLGPPGISNLSGSVLTDGSYVFTAELEGRQEDHSIWFNRARTIDGGPTIGSNEITATVDNDAPDRDPSIAGLTAGGFVVVWQSTVGNDTDVLFQRHTAAGAPVGGVVKVNGGGATDNNNEPAIVALSDGGFIVFYDDDKPATAAGRGQRYSATGVAVGTEFVIDTQNANDIQAVLLDDGRVAVSWSNGEIQMGIFDIRDSENAVVGTSGVQAGTVGNDTFTSSSAARVVNTSDGADSVTQGVANGPTDFQLGSGNDFMFVTSGLLGDRFDGGDGIDTINWSGSGQANATYDLLNGLASTKFTSEVMTNFENITTTDSNDTVIGTDYNNVINLLDGNDSAEGNGGADLITGNGGNDTLRGGSGNDSLFGDDGNDILYGDSGTDSLSGGDGNDTIFGGETFDDTIFGGAGDDTIEVVGGGLIDGGADNDTFVVRNGIVIGDTDLTDDDLVDGGDGIDTFDARNEAGVGYSINLLAATVDRGGAGTGRTITLKNVENAIGTNQSDAITGDDGANNLNGAGGNDTLNGGAGHDVIGGGNGNDVVHGDEGNDTLYGGQNNDTVYGGQGNDSIYGGLGQNELYGDDGNDQIFAAAQGGDFIGGGAGNDTIRGDDGADTIYGGLDDDNIGGGLGNDMIFGSAGSNTIWTGLGNDTVEGGSGADTIYGSGGPNQVFGNDGDDLIYTGATGDFVGGGAGNDRIFGGNGADTIFGGLDDDYIGGGAGNDVIHGSAGTNRIFGGLGDDTIVAGSSRDVMTGSPGADVFVFGSAAQIGIAAGRDVITDFTSGVDDIDLRALGTTFNGITGLTGDGVNSFYYFASGGLLIGDHNGDGSADWVLELSGAPAVTAGDFLL